MDKIKIKRALVSVFDKTDILTLGKFLQSQNIEILSTGGTLKALEEANIPVISLEEYTQSPEMLGGRVKTLHPKVHGALLARIDKKEDLETLEKYNIEKIDLLVVNLYPFAQTITKENISLEEAIENIDIGGPTMIRASAKNFASTTVICDPKDYSQLILEMEKDCSTSREFRWASAKKAFALTAIYDQLISSYLSQISLEKEKDLPHSYQLNYHKNQNLRYGENPHQKGAYYLDVSSSDRPWKQLQGKELSYNNILDADSAIRTVENLPKAGIAIIKHLNPCGASIIKKKETSDLSLSEAFRNAQSCDPISAFGGIIAISGEVGEGLAKEITQNFVEVILAHSYHEKALEIFSQKNNLRILSYQPKFINETIEIRNALGGLLVQERDKIRNHYKHWQSVSNKKVSDAEKKAMLFAWHLCKQVKSNAIVFCSEYSSLGIGAGQMSRLDSVEIAISKAKKAGLDLKDSIVASDAFFPFRDGIDAIAKTGAKAIIHPGGSVRDKEIIQAANEHGLQMLFTKERHFLH